MDKIKFEDNDILERFYQETNTSQVEILTEKQFLNLPLNPEYERNQLKKREEAINELLETLSTCKKIISVKDNNEPRQQ